MVRALQPADPRLIGPYRLVGQLGSGGMGRVFLAMSAGGRPVAVKMIRAELAADPDFRSRFSREVAAARRVNGLFTALVVDADVDAQVPWLATAYVAGPSLAETVKDHGPLSAKSVLALAAGLAEGLSAIHSAGVVHGDLKPSNVLLAEDGPRVIDFGISHAAEMAPLTHPGLVMGSPGFMSPEQALGQKVGPLSDVFSLGTVLGFAATGQRPFGTGTPVELLDRVVHGEPNLDGVPAEVRPLIERCMAKKPGDRPTAAHLLAEMGAVQATTDWLPESIVRMIRRDLPPSGEEDRKGITGVGGTQTVTLGSAAQEAAQASATAAPADHSPPVDRARTTEHAQAGERAQTEDQAPHGNDHAYTQDQVDSGEDPQTAGPGPAAGQAPADAPPEPADPAAPEDQFESDDQSSTSGPQQAGEGDGKPRDRLGRPLVAACLIAGLLATSGIVGAALVELTRHLTASSPGTPGATTGPSPSSVGTSPPASAQPPSKLPEITNYYTYQQGEMMYFNVYYTDPGNNAAGFGFEGVDGSKMAQQEHPFSSPAEGIVEPGSIIYPLNQECGTAQHHSSVLRVWIYDTAGVRSNAVTVHLVCAPDTASGP
jgi:serine/threonine protein kinase